MQRINMSSQGLSQIYLSRGRNGQALYNNKVYFMKFTQQYNSTLLQTVPPYTLGCPAFSYFDQGCVPKKTIKKYRKSEPPCWQWAPLWQ